jgi:hypothetical protein
MTGTRTTTRGFQPVPTITEKYEFARLFRRTASITIPTAAARFRPVRDKCDKSVSRLLPSRTSHRLGVQQLDQLVDAQFGLPKNREQGSWRNDLASMYGNDHESIQAWSPIVVVTSARVGEKETAALERGADGFAGNSRRLRQR